MYMTKNNTHIHRGWMTMGLTDHDHGWGGRGEPRNLDHIYIYIYPMLRQSRVSRGFSKPLLIEDSTGLYLPLYILDYHNPSFNIFVEGRHRI